METIVRYGDYVAEYHAYGIVPLYAPANAIGEWRIYDARDAQMVRTFVVETPETPDDVLHEVRHVLESLSKTEETETMETTGTTEQIVLHPYPHMGCYADDNGTCYTQNDGSITWPEWEGIETCSCGAALPEVCDNDCTECGTPLWHLVSPECANCGERIHFDSTCWVCLDDGSDYCMECVTVTP